MKELFLTSASDQVMDNLIQHLPKHPKDLNLAFINTAAEIEEGDHWWVRDEKNKLLDVGFNLEEFSITGMQTEEICEKLNNKQVFYFCGGNPFYLLDQIIKTGCDEILKEKINMGVIYIGSSAGSMIVGTRIDLVSTAEEKEKAPDLQSTGLEIVDLSILPHWGSDDLQDEYVNGIGAMYTEGIKILPLTNQQYVWIKDDSMQIIQV